MPSVEIHIITYNEHKMLPFTIQHYRKMFKDLKFVVHDNNSTDETKILAQLAGCEIIPFTTEGMNDTVQSYIKSQAVMNSTADWILCIDCDEECLINDNDLQELDNKEVNIVKFEGWDIFDSVASPFDVTEPKGCRSPGYYKPILLKPLAFDHIVFGAGAHAIESINARPGVEIKWSIEEYKLLHYKHWSSEWNISRSKELASRQSQENLARGYSSHFALPDQAHQDWFDNHDKSKELIIDSRL